MYEQFGYGIHGVLHFLSVLSAFLLLSLTHSLTGSSTLSFVPSRYAPAPSFTHYRSLAYLTALSLCLSAHSRYVRRCDGISGRLSVSDHARSTRKLHGLSFCPSLLICPSNIKSLIARLLESSLFGRILESSTETTTPYVYLRLVQVIPLR